MALVLADRVKDTTTTTGTGAITLADAAPVGFRTFGAAIGNGNTTYYTIAGVGTSEWEVGIGTYTASGTSLSRDTVLSSSNAGSLVNFSAGVKDVFVTYPAEKSVNYDTSGNVNISITGSAASATNLLGGTANSIPYQTGAGATTFLATGTGVLVASGGAPSWSQTPTLTSVALTSGTVSTTPSSGTDLANKAYVDTMVSSGITYHTPVKYEVPNTTGNLNATYNNGTGGVGATLTNAGTLGAFTPDGVVASVGDRILIYNQTNAAQNGVYTVTTVGNGSTPWVLTRATDANSYGVKSPTALGEGDAFFVTSGNTGAGETYVCNTVGTINFGTTAITFTQVSSAQVYSAGTGLTLTGTQFSLTSPVATSLGGTGLTSYTSGGAVYATSTSALTTGTLPVTAGGTGQTSFTNGQLLIGNTTGNTLTKATLTAGAGISVTNGAGSITVTNTAPDQTVTLTAGSNMTITGTYPNFTLSSSDQFVGTVTSVSGTGSVNGITLSGTVTSSGSLTLGGTLTGVSLATQVTGTLPVANGGTGATTLTSGYLVKGNGISAVSASLVYDNGTNIGINTTSPAQKLHVNGNAILGGSPAAQWSNVTLANDVGIQSATPLLNFVNAAGSARFGYLNHTGTGGNLYLLNQEAGALLLGTNNAERARIDSSGNFGIGTSSPGAKLDAQGTGNVYVRARSLDTTGATIGYVGAEFAGGSALQMRAGLGYTYLVSTGASDPLLIGTNTTERMRVTSAGDVGIGTNSPAAKLDVNGVIKGTAFTGIDGGTF